MDAPVAPGNAREPCPDRILDDVGGAFAMGAIGGTALQLIKGAYTSPKGSRLSGGAQLARLNGPRIGGSFAVWGGLFSTFDCSLVYLRQKEDPWNSILAGAGAGGLLSLRQGVRPAMAAAAFGGVLLAMIEGVGVFLTNQSQKRMEEAAFAMQQQQQQQPTPPGLPQNYPNVEQASNSGEILQSFETPSSQYGMQSSFSEFGDSSSQNAGSSKEGSSSWFGGLFGGGKKQEKSGGSSKADILESFDAPSPPIRFDYK